MVIFIIVYLELLLHDVVVVELGEGKTVVGHENINAYVVSGELAVVAWTRTANGLSWIIK